MARLGARVVAALVVVAVVVGTCAGAQGSELEVHNDLFNETIAVYYPPAKSRCAKCTTHVCPEFCLLYTDVNLKYTKCGTLDSKAGPYPLSYLKIVTPAVGGGYCVAGNDLSLLTNHALVTVSSVACGVNSTGLAAAVAQIQGDSGSRVCTHPATIKNLQVICLEAC